MTEHVHGCLTCKPDMVPDFNRADLRYHDHDKCGVLNAVTVDGIAPGYTKGVFEGDEGWVLLAGRGFDTSNVHLCPNCTTYNEDEGYQVIDRHELCVEPAFGRVEVVHECPAIAEARRQRIEAMA